MKKFKFLILKVFLIQFCLSLDQFFDCDFSQLLSTSSIYEIISPAYPGNYLKGTQCRWEAEAPQGFKISLSCSQVELSPSIACFGDKISVSTTGRLDLANSKHFCNPFQIESASNRMTMALKAGRFSRGGRFRCKIKAVKNNCVCGKRNRGKIGKLCQGTMFKFFI